jgi:hypothetical protein
MIPCSYVKSGVTLIFTLGISAISTSVVESTIHYCRNCGIRLAYVCSGTCYGVREDSLLSSRASTEAGTSSGHLIADSPFGLPPSFVDTKLLAATYDRYRDMKPRRILTIDCDELLKIPLSVWDRNRLYKIERPDFTMRRFGAAKLVIFVAEVDEGTPTVWSSNNPSISLRRVEDERVVGTIQYQPLIWDVGLYFREDSDSPVETPWTRQICSLDGREINDNRGCLFFSWKSSAGVLVWTTRKIADGADAVLNASSPIHRRMVLLDAYDRLVAAEYGALRKAVPQAGEAVEALELRLYGDFSEKLTSEIVLTHTALCGQLRRIENIDEEKNRSMWFGG